MGGGSRINQGFRRPLTKGCHGCLKTAIGAAPPYDSVVYCTRDCLLGRLLLCFRQTEDVGAAIRSSDSHQLSLAGNRVRLDPFLCGVSTPGSLCNMRDCPGAAWYIAPHDAQAPLFEGSTFGRVSRCHPRKMPCLFRSCRLLCNTSLASRHTTTTSGNAKRQNPGPGGRAGCHSGQCGALGVSGNHGGCHIPPNPRRRGGEP
jgi:hypothetical protein